MEDIYQLPQLDGAAVLSGHNLLWRKVTSVRVLRGMDYIEHEIGFDKNELAITSFGEIWEEPHLQKRFIEEIVRAGIVWLILFSNVPGRNGMKPDVVELSRSLSLPVICLRGKNNPILCGEIVGAANCLLRDAENENTLSIAMLDNMTRRSPGEQSIQAAAKLLGSWMNASIILTDIARNVIASSRYGPVEPISILRQAKVLPTSQTDEPIFIDGFYLYHTELQQFNATVYHFYVLRSVRLEKQELTSLANAMQFAIRLWGQRLDTTTLELVKAMLQDEPLKKSQLAAMFHINVEDMDALWILNCGTAERNKLHDKLNKIRNLELMKRTLSLSDIYEQSIVIFLEKPETLEEIQQLQQEILRVSDADNVLFSVENLPNNAEVRNIYQVYIKYASDCRTIFPTCRVMSDAHLNLAMECRQLMLTSPNYSDIIISPVYQAKGKWKPQEMVNFLSAFLLDANMDINLMADTHCLHRNTIRYRLNPLSNVFGFTIGSIPETNYLILVCALLCLQQ